MNKQIVPAWRREEEREKVPTPFVFLIKEARIQNCWIYHRKTKKWYTPEEFEAAAWSLFYKDRDDRTNVDEFAIMDPISGLRVRQQTLKKVTDEILSFQKRIDDYYKIHLKAK